MSTSETSSLASGALSVTLELAVCNLDSPLLVDRDTNVYKSRQNRHVESSELDDSFEKWTLQLFDDSSNTRSYVCRCLVQVAGLTEDESFRKMMRAHEHGKAIIGEYSSKEHAEHYKESLTSSGLDSDIFPVEE